MKSVLRRLIISGFLIFFTFTNSAFSQGWNVEMTSWLYHHWHGAWWVDIDSCYAYVAASFCLSIIDISDPNNPEEVSFVDASINCLTVSGGYAYTAGSNFQIVEITDPTNPTVTGTCEIPLGSTDIEVSGNYAYVTFFYDGLKIIDISNPSNPQIVGSLEASNISEDVAIYGDYAFVAACHAGLLIINVSDPTDPFLEETYYSTSVYVVEISGNYAYVNCGNGLTILDITDPTDPEELGSAPYSCYGMDIQGNYAYLALYDLRIVNISNPYNPISVGYLEIEGFGEQVAVTGNTAIFTKGAGGIVVIDITIPTNPVEITDYQHYGYAYEVDVQGDYAYLADGLNGLKIIDVTDPYNPSEIGQCDTSAWNSVVEILVSEDYAYVSAPGTGIFALDISNPNNPYVVGSIYTHDYYVYCFHKVDNFLYAAGYDVEFRVFDVSQPSLIYQAAFLEIPGRSEGVAISGNYAYLACNYGLSIVDITNPTNPSFIDSIYIRWYAENIDVSGDIMCVPASEGVYLFDIYDPLDPEILAIFPMSDNDAYHVKIVGEYVFVAARYSGIKILNIADPTNPMEVGYYDTPGLAYCTDVSGSYAYVGDYSHFEIFDCSQALPVSSPNYSSIPGKFSLLPAYPNPFNASTVLTYTIPQQGKITLTIYNLLGQEITTLYNDTQIPGTHTATWNAKNHASGIYFAQLQGVDYTNTIKMVLMK